MFLISVLLICNLPEDCGLWATAAVNQPVVQPVTGCTSLHDVVLAYHNGLNLLCWAWPGAGMGIGNSTCAIDEQQLLLYP
jgi:hypothetical protein